MPDWYNKMSKNVIIIFSSIDSHLSSNLLPLRFVAPSMQKSLRQKIYLSFRVTAENNCNRSCSYYFANNVSKLKQYVVSDEKKKGIRSLKVEVKKQQKHKYSYTIIFWSSFTGLNLWKIQSITIFFILIIEKLLSSSYMIIVVRAKYLISRK